MHPKSFQRLFRLLLIIMPVFVAGCLGEGDGKEKIAGTPKPPLIGQLVDANIMGAGWETSGGASGLTSSLGEFEYLPFETVTFTVGGIVLGTVPGAPIVTPVELTNSSDPTNRAALNQLVFLQSIDADADHSNGISITDAARSLAEGLALDFTDPNFATAVASVVATITGSANTVVSESRALSNFYATYVELGGSDAVSFPFPGFPPVGGGVAYELVFADEFDEGTVPSPDNWTLETGYGPNNFGWGNNEWQLYTESTDNVRVEDGNLVISALCPSPPCGVRDGTITSGKINSLNKFNFRYGKVIARIKPPVGEAAWPAFWALGTNFPQVGWPRSGEIDFMEMHNAFSDDRTTHFTMHWCDETDAPPPPELCFPQSNGWVFDSQNETFDGSLGDDFHIFEADWEADRVIGKIDGVTVFNRTIDPATMEEFQRQFYMIFNVAMGGTLGSNNQPPNGTETFPQTMLVDYVRVYQRVGSTDPDPDPDPVTEDFAIDFEGPAESYDFGVDGGFEGGAAAVVANPVSGGINTSAQVARMLKFQGADFAGSLLALPEPVVLEAGSAFTMKVWSPRPVMVLLKLEGPVEAQLDVPHSGSGWEELTFSYPTFSGSVTGLTVIFDLGVVGDAEGDPDNWTFYFDDITLVPPGDDPGGGLAQIDLPVSFDDPLVDYTLVDFGTPVAAMTTLVPDPDDNTNTVASTTKPMGAPVWAGTTIGTGAGFATAIPFTASATTIGVRVYSPAAGIPVRLKAENEAEGAITVEAQVLTTVADEWETLVFDFADEVEGDPLDLTAAYFVLSIFFNFGTDGDTAGAQTYLWDDVEFGVLPPVVDLTPPTLTSVSIASNNANPALATTGDVVTVVLTADEPITAPAVLIGGVAADSVTGGGVNWQASRALTGADADGTVSFSVEFADLAGNVGTPESMVTDGSGVVLDGTAPSVTIEGAPATFTTLSAISLTFQFTEPVTGFVLADIQVTNGAASALSGVGDTYTANVTPNGTGDLTITVAAGAAMDAVGNLSESAEAVTVLNGLDADQPLLTFINITSSNVNPLYARMGDVVTISMTATEEILAPVVSIAGVPAEDVTGGGTQWQASRMVIATDQEGPDPIGFVINFQDLSGNAGPESTVVTDPSSVIFDFTGPTPTISGLPTTITAPDPFTVTIQFDEDAIGFDASDISVTNGTAENFTGADAMYTVEIAPVGNGELVLSLADDAATDAAGNGSAAASASGTVDLQPFWSLVWSDDFNGVALDTGVWNVRTDANCPTPCEEGLQSYTTDRVRVAGGKLLIDAQAAAGPIYTSGLVDTRGNRELKYGRIEIDAKMPGTVGAAPSLWMLPVGDAYGAWPTSGEIDIVNAPDLGVSNETLVQALRYGLPVPEDTLTFVDDFAAPAAPDMEFLTYAIEWEAGEIRWFVNGVHAATQTQDNWYAYSEDADGVYTLGTGAAPFDEDFYLVLSLAIGSNADSGSMFPQVLEIDAVRVYECANALDPAAGTGCSTGTGIAPVEAPSAPYTDMLEVYTDAPAVLTFAEGTNALMAGSSGTPSGTVMVSDTAFADGANTVWRVDIATAIPGFQGEVFIGSEDLSADPDLDTGFDLTGAGTAGEVIFDMRIISSTGGTQLAVRLDSPAGNGGEVSLPLPTDNEWRTYSVKIADLIASPVGDGLDLTNVVNLFALDVTGGNVVLDLDNIRVKVACRDDGACQPGPRLNMAVEQYRQDFELLDQMDPDALSSDAQGGFPGWLVFANIFEPDGVTYIRGYGAFAAPNGGAGFSAIDAGQGGPTQGAQQLSIYNDYNNNADQSAGNRVEALVFQERSITADDVGSTIVFSFDAKRGNINDPGDDGCTGTANPPCDSTANAFIKTLNPAAGFATTNFVPVDMTEIPVDWNRYTLSLIIDAGLVGQLLQFGFSSNASNFEPSGIFYDNILVVK